LEMTLLPMEKTTRGMDHPFEDGRTSHGENHGSSSYRPIASSTSPLFVTTQYLANRLSATSSQRRRPT
jgi:hypothetical protein